jgi:hypothetical protein
MCKDSVTKNDVRDSFTKAEEIVRQESLRRRREVSDCLWDGIKKWHIAPFFCPLSSEIFMRNFDGTHDFVLQKFCTENSKSSLARDIGCKLGKLLQQKRQAIRSSVKTYLCENKRQKRQFDAVTLMRVFTDTSCGNSARYNFDFVALGNDLYLNMYGIWCCLIKFVDT